MVKSIGVLATCVALVGASQQFRGGNRESFNRFLRFRVVAQGVTIAACVIGSLVYAKDSTVEKAIAREKELEKIRVAGTRSLATTTESFSEAVNSPTPSASNPAPTPVTPATSEELWKKWGVSKKS